MPEMHDFVFAPLYLVVALLLCVVVFPEQIFWLLVAVYLSLRQLIDRLGGFDQKEQEEVRRRVCHQVEAFTSRLPSAALFILRLCAYPLLPLLWGLKKLFPLPDKEELERTRRMVEDVDHFLGRDR